MSNSLDEHYWSDRYHKQLIGWDVGRSTPPIQQYLDQISDKSLKVLIPGAGNAYEASYAFKTGFQQLFVLDISELPLQNFKTANPKFPSSQILHEDFFSHNGNYDLILEQTFFCALDPILRSKYVKKMYELLNPGGKLVGVLFNKQFEKQGPPFGGDKLAYEKLFQTHFKINVLENCYNSIPPRSGEEVFINFEKSDS